MNALKYLSEYSNIFVNSVLVSVDFLCLFILFYFISDFPWKHGHFECYVMGLWVFFKHSVLAGFSTLHREGLRGLSRYCWVVVQVQVPF